MKFSILSFSGLLAAKLWLMPDLSLLIWVLVATGVDLVTGIVKSKLQGNNITSKGLRETIKKLIQNLGLIAVGLIIMNAVKEKNELLMWATDGLMLFILYTELYSIIENLRDMNPESKVSKMIFVPLLTLLTLGIDKLSLNKKTGGTGDTVNIILIMATLAIFGCTVIKPGTNTSSDKSDSSWTNYKQVPVDVKGATVGSNINTDSLINRIKELMAASAKSTPVGEQPNLDSIFAAFKAGLKPIKDTVTVTDPNAKVVLKYWMDEAGKLQMTCTSKDETINVLVAENNKLRREIEKSQTVHVEYKMPWWGWLAVGWSLVSTGALILLLYLAFKTRL